MQWFKIQFTFTIVISLFVISVNQLSVNECGSLTYMNLTVLLEVQIKIYG